MLKTFYKGANMDHNNDTFSNLYDVLSSIETADEMRLLLEDLCTYKELEYLNQRLNSAIMLLEGATYQQVSDSVDNISTATLSRVSRCIKHGSGGYSEVLKKYIKKGKENNA
jgi:TrpR-related protein YerC/YecD